MESSTTRPPTSTAQATACYTRLGPTPPFISLPSLRNYSATSSTLTISPTILPALPSSTPFDLLVAALGYRHIARATSASNWEWNMRHEAQSITRGLMVGPSLVAKNREWLEGWGVSLVVTVIDPRLIPWQGRMKKSVEEAGVGWRWVEVGEAGELVGRLSGAVEGINGHLVEVFTERVTRAGLMLGEVVGAAAEAYATGDEGVMGEMDRRLDGFRGRVLVACESGNSRAVTVVTGYLMAVMGCDIDKAAQFVSMVRFCATFEEEYKRVLVTWSDILQARLQVIGSEGGICEGKGKRKAMRQEGQGNEEEEGRGGFVPFIDVDE